MFRGLLGRSQTESTEKLQIFHKSYFTFKFVFFCYNFFLFTLCFFICAAIQFARNVPLWEKQYLTLTEKAKYLTKNKSLN